MPKLLTPIQLIEVISVLDALDDTPLTMKTVNSINGMRDVNTAVERAMDKILSILEVPYRPRVNVVYDSRKKMSVRSATVSRLRRAAKKL